MKQSFFVTQDGADFYVFDSAACDNLIMTRTAPMTVGLDLDRAMKAREWFLSHQTPNQIIHWPNPFARVEESTL